MTRMRITTERPGVAPLPTVDLTTSIGQLELPSPVLTASGCAGSGRELDQFIDITRLGAVVTKSVMMRPRAGRPTPRMSETPSGMLNSIGLQGPGIDAFVENDLAWLRHRGARAIVSIAGGTVDEYTKLAQRLRNSDGVSAVEVNISCPNVESRGHVFACDPVAAAGVVAAVRRATTPGVPVIVKLSPDVTDIVAVAHSVVTAGADALALVNTTLGMVIDPHTLRPVLAGTTGGLSGPAIRPMAVRCVYQVHAAMPHVPICGMGGIRTGADALEFILAGASTVSAGTVLFNDPSAPTRIERELTIALAAAGFDRLADAIGYAHRPQGPGEVAGDETAAPHPEHQEAEDSDDFGPDVDALAQ
jgi:dihydroorotate dehydrogenase (NAD+) catalytic subunit